MDSHRAISRRRRLLAGVVLASALAVAVAVLHESDESPPRSAGTATSRPTLDSGVDSSQEVRVAERSTVRSPTEVAEELDVPRLLTIELRDADARTVTANARGTALRTRERDDGFWTVDLSKSETTLENTSIAIQLEGGCSIEIEGLTRDELVVSPDLAWSRVAITGIPRTAAARFTAQPCDADGEVQPAAHGDASQWVSDGRARWHMPVVNMEVTPLAESEFHTPTGMRLLVHARCDGFAIEPSEALIASTPGTARFHAAAERPSILLTHAARNDLATGESDAEQWTVALYDPAAPSCVRTLTWNPAVAATLDADDRGRQLDPSRDYVIRILDADCRQWIHPIRFEDGLRASLVVSQQGWVEPARWPADRPEGLEPLVLADSGSGTVYVLVEDLADSSTPDHVLWRRTRDGFCITRSADQHPDFALASTDDHELVRLQAAGLQTIPGRRHRLDSRALADATGRMGWVYTVAMPVGNGPAQQITLDRGAGDLTTLVERTFWRPEVGVVSLSATGRNRSQERSRWNLTDWLSPVR